MCAAIGCRHQSSVLEVDIVQTMSHPALDSLRINAEAELRAAGYTNIVERNAAGQENLLQQIARELDSRNPGVIIAITTPAAQATVKVAHVPVVFAAVTAPVEAGVVPSLDHPQATVTGTSDAWPYREQLQLIRTILPSARNLGVLYNPGESSAQHGIEQLKRFAPAAGFNIVDGPVSSTLDVYSAARQLASHCDALLIDSDNTAIAGEAAAVKVAEQRKIPLFAGDSGSVANGAIGAVSVGYAQLGTETGKLAVRMLHGERNIPVFVGRGDQVVLNRDAANRMGVTLPETLLKSAQKVYPESPR
jgi:putative ABC transport system substrate-binding protein